MKFRWTMKDLEEKTDLEFLRGIIVERQSTLNIYAPLNLRLSKIYNKLDSAIHKGKTKLSEVEK